MKTLLRKELRSQLPFALLIGFLILINIFEYLVGEYPDGRSLAHLLNAHDDDGVSMGIPYLILAMALALALLPREHDEGTLEFLDALPCTRGRVFAAKAMAGILILGLYPVLDNALGLVVHRFARSSLDPEWPLRLFGQMLLIEWSVCISLLGIAMALSFFRRFAFLVLGLLAAIFLMLQVLEFPWIHLFDFTEPLRYTFQEQNIVVAWRSLGVTVALGAAGYVVASLVFRMQGDRTTRVFSWIERHHLRGPLTVAGTMVMILVWVGVGIWFSATKSHDTEEDAPQGRVAFREWHTSQIRAGDYVFLYPSNLSSRAAALAGKAGEVHARVRGFFSADPVGEIVADLNSELRHLAGSAEWKRINMSIVETRELGEQIAVLGHETTHVYIDALSNGRLRSAFQYSRWWHEGLASHLEYQLFRPSGDSSRIQKVAAAAHRRKASEFELLVDDQAWRLKHDPDLCYSLGQVFFEALIAEHGSEAPGKILRALARPEAPEALEGLDLWRDSFQACGWDLSTAVAGYYRRLHELAESEQKEFVDSLPKLRGRVIPDKTGVTISVVPSGDLPNGAKLQCRVRRFADSTDTDTHYLYESAPGEFSSDRSLIGDGEFWYQLGLDHPETQFTIYEDWQRARAQ